VVPAAIALTVGVAPYLLIRLGVECFGLRETSRSYWSHSGLLAASAGQLVAGAWQGLRAGWPAVAAFLILGSSRVDLPTRLAACAGVVTAFAANLLVAQDLSRSASVLLPVLVAGVLLGVKAWPKAAPVAVTLLCIADLLLPARHILNIYEVPIERFPAELARWRQRPNLRDSAYLTGQGYTAMRRQDPENALQWFDAALSADSANGEARVNRGVLLCTVDGKPDEGLAELSRALTVNPGLLDAMVARNPELLELRFVRAYVEMQGGNPEAAAVDLREILPRAPLSSPLRQKTQELLQQVENRSR
jgi:tetratricopeptide (TPR) repeat protein